MNGIGTKERLVDGRDASHETADRFPVALSRQGGPGEAGERCRRRQVCRHLAVRPGRGEVDVLSHWSAAARWSPADGRWVVEYHQFSTVLTTEPPPLSAQPLSKSRRDRETQRRVCERPVERNAHRGEQRQHGHADGRYRVATGPGPT